MLADFLATEQHRAIAAFLTGLPCSRSVRRLLVVIIAAASPAILYVAWHSSDRRAVPKRASGRGPVAHFVSFKFKLSQRTSPVCENR